MEDAEIKLILDTQASNTRVHELATEVKALNEYMRELAVRYNEATISEKDYVTYAADANAELREKSTILRQVAGDLDIVEKSHQNFGSTILQTSYAVQDFTSQLGTRGLGGALAAIQNNIPGILTGLGAGQGLAGVVSVLSVAMGAALPHIEAFFTGLDPEKAKAAADKVKTLAEEAKALTTAPKGEVEKDVAAGFGKFAAAGFDVASMAAAAIGASPTGAIATGAQQASVEQYRMGERIASLPGGGAVGLALQYTGTSPEQLAEQLRAANLKRAGDLVATATHPGDAGRKARNELRRLSRDNPGAFPPEFNEFLTSVEETSAERALAEAAIEEEDPDTQYAAAHKAGMERRNQALEDEKAAKKRADQVAQTYVDDEKLNQQELARLEREKKAAARQADHDRKERDREAKAAARDADPGVMAAKERAALEDQARRMAPGIIGGMGLQPNRHQYESMIRGAVGNMPQGGGTAELAQAIQQAAWAGYQKAQEDLARQMKRQQSFSNTRGDF